MLRPTPVCKIGGPFPKPGVDNERTGDVPPSDREAVRRHAAGRDAGGSPRRRDPAGEAAATCAAGPPPLRMSRPAGRCQEWVAQREEKDCGVAALAMVARACGQHPSVETLR